MNQARDASNTAVAYESAPSHNSNRTGDGTGSDEHFVSKRARLMQSYKESLRRRYAQEQDKKMGAFAKSGATVADYTDDIETAKQIQASGITFEFGKVSNKRFRSEIEAERLQEELRVHTAHKRQKVDEYERVDREKLERVVATKHDKEDDDEGSDGMAGPSLDLFFP